MDCVLVRVHLPERVGDRRHSTAKCESEDQLSSDSEGAVDSSLSLTRALAEVLE